jgi:proteasome regulatory subunit
MQLLAELDGFDPIGEVKIIAATNRVDILDDALLRPGRFDRIIEIPIPSRDARVKIFEIHTQNMSLDKGIDFGILADRTPDATGADIKAICMEAGMFAIRDERKKIKLVDFEDAIVKILEDETGKGDSGVMFA